MLLLKTNQNEKRGSSTPVDPEPLPSIPHVAHTKWHALNKVNRFEGLVSHCRCWCVWKNYFLWESIFAISSFLMVFQKYLPSATIVGWGICSTHWKCTPESSSFRIFQGKLIPPSPQPWRIVDRILGMGLAMTNTNFCYSCRCNYTGGSGGIPPLPHSFRVMVFSEFWEFLWIYCSRY